MPFVADEPEGHYIWEPDWADPPQPAKDCPHLDEFLEVLGLKLRMNHVPGSPKHCWLENPPGEKRTYTLHSGKLYSLSDALRILAEFVRPE